MTEQDFKDVILNGNLRPLVMVDSGLEERVIGDDLYLVKRFPDSGEILYSVETVHGFRIGIVRGYRAANETEATIFSDNELLEIGTELHK